MTLLAVFPNGFTAQLTIIRSPFNLFRAQADNFIYWDEFGERQHICTQSVESWAKYNGVKVIGSKLSHFEHSHHSVQSQQNNDEPIHQSISNGLVIQVRRRVPPNDSNRNT